MPKLNTWNCSLIHTKKFTGFCQVLKEMHMKENWFLFSAHGVDQHSGTYSF